MKRETVIVIPGVMSVAADYQPFAQALAPNFEVHVMERRGENHSIAQECDDVIALQNRTRANYLFGHSFGGLVAIEVARRCEAFTKIALYEPGVSVNGSIPIAWISQYQRELTDGKYLDAFTSFSLAAAPRRARKTPRWLMKLILHFYLKRFDKQQLSELLRVNLLQHLEIARLDGAYPNYRGISARVLLITGEPSGLPWVPPGIAALSATLPDSQTQSFPKLDHLAPTNSGSTKVAQAVAEFFSVTASVHPQESMSAPSPSPNR